MKISSQIKVKILKGMCGKDFYEYWKVGKSYDRTKKGVGRAQGNTIWASKRGTRRSFGDHDGKVGHYFEQHTHWFLQRECAQS